MNIYTGNFANVTKYRNAGLHPVSISLSARYFTGDLYRPLNPERVFMNDPDEVYTPKFNAILAKLDVNKVIEDLTLLANGKDVIMLCHEGENDFCHRHLVAKWMEEKLNIEVKELGKMQKETQKIVQLQLL